MLPSERQAGHAGAAKLGYGHRTDAAMGHTRAAPAPPGKDPRLPLSDQDSETALVLVGSAEEPMICLLAMAKPPSETPSLKTATPASRVRSRDSVWAGGAITVSANSHHPSRIQAADGLRSARSAEDPIMWVYRPSEDSFC